MRLSSETYLTRGKNNAIIIKYNDKEYMPVFDDKIAFNKKFNDFLNRDWLDLDDTEFEEFQAFNRKASCDNGKAGGRHRRNRCGKI